MVKFENTSLEQNKKFPAHTILLGSGSESPKDEALLLSMVLYFKKFMKIKI